MEVNFIRIYQDQDDKLWTFLLCRSDKETDDQMRFMPWYDTAGEAMDAAIKWCEDRGLDLNWYSPMAVWRKGSVDSNVVQAAGRFTKNHYPTGA